MSIVGFVTVWAGEWVVLFVIPAKAGIYMSCQRKILDSRFRGNDNLWTGRPCHGCPNCHARSIVWLLGKRYTGRRQDGIV